MRECHQSGAAWSAYEVFLCSAVVLRCGSVPRGGVFVASLAVQLRGAKVCAARTFEGSSEFNLSGGEPLLGLEATFLGVGDRLA